MPRTFLKLLDGVILLCLWQVVLTSKSPKDYLGIINGELHNVTEDYTVEGNLLIKFQQIVCDVPVLGSHAVLESGPGGEWVRIQSNQISADFYPTVCPSTVATNKTALLKRMADVEGDSLSDILPFDENMDALVYWVQLESIRLVWQMTYVIISNISEDTGDTQLAGRPIRKTFIVDTDTEKVFSRDVSIASLSYDMIGVGGNIVQGKHQFGSWGWAGRKLRVDRTAGNNSCAAKNEFIDVHDASGTFTCGLVTYSDTCDNMTELNTDSFNQVNDVLFYGTHFLDMMKNLYRDTSIQELCGSIYACANYGIHDNAHYGSCKVYFGSGNIFFYGLATADVVAHELCHGVTAKLSGLRYTEESGGINEAFSDMCGEVYESFLRDGKNDWKVAYGIMKYPYAMDALRYMEWPPKDGKSIQCQANFYSNMNVHYSSGLYNKAFFLLATTPGWDITRAFKVFLRANKFIWTPTSNFNNASCGVGWAAMTYGYSVRDVENAFAAVGIFCACPPGFIKRNDWSCYKFVRDLASWAEAKVTCEALGATLAVVEDVSEYNWIQLELSSPSIWPKSAHSDLNGHSAYWIGASDQGVKNDWKWLSVSSDYSVDYLDWAFGQPDNQNDAQNCIALASYYYNINFKYFDEDCHEKKYFLCERTCKHYEMVR